MTTPTEAKVIRDIVFCSKADIDDLKQLLKEANEYVTMAMLKFDDAGAKDLHERINKALGF